ncbi:MAG: AAA family ATPase [Candidatus Thermoplasmatota archaeon]
MIDRINIKNFRSIRDATITGMPRIIGIWGPNGSGKSNLLQAVYFAHNRDMAPLHIRSQWDILTKTLPPNATGRVHIKMGNEYEWTTEFNGENLYKTTGTPPKQCIYLPPWRHISDKDTDLSEEFTFRYISDGRMTQNFIHSEITRLSTAAMGGDRKAHEIYDYITNWAKSVGLGRISSRLRTKTTTTTYDDPIYGEMDVPDAGFGGRSALSIIVAVFLTKDKVILIEEPEISLHPAAQAAMAEWLVYGAERQAHQIIFTSHSEYLAKRFAKMLKEKKVDSRIFKAMLAKKTAEEGTTYQYIEPESLIKNLEESRPIIPQLHERE